MWHVVITIPLSHASNTIVVRVPDGWLITQELKYIPLLIRDRGTFFYLLGTLWDREFFGYNCSFFFAKKIYLRALGIVLNGLKKSYTNMTFISWTREYRSLAVSSCVSCRYLCKWRLIRKSWLVNCRVEWILLRLKPACILFISKIFSTITVHR